MLYPFFQHVNYTKPLSALEGKLLWRFTSGSRYERRIWRCNRKYDPAGDQPCATKHVTEDELIAAFEQATRQLAPPPSPEVLEAALDQLGNPHVLEAKLAQVITARDAVVDEINALIRSAATPTSTPTPSRLTMPPSTPTEQSLSHSTTDESVVRLHPLAPGAYDLGLLYLRSQSALTPIIMYAIQVYRRYPPHNWNQ